MSQERTARWDCRTGGRRQSSRVGTESQEEGLERRIGESLERDRAARRARDRASPDQVSATSRPQSSLEGARARPDQSRRSGEASSQSRQASYRRNESRPTFATQDPRSIGSSDRSESIAPASRRASSGERGTVATSNPPEERLNSEERPPLQALSYRKPVGREVRSYSSGAVWWTREPGQSQRPASAGNVLSRSGERSGIQVPTPSATPRALRAISNPPSSIRSSDLMESSPGPVRPTIDTRQITAQGTITPPQRSPGRYLKENEKKAWMEARRARAQSRAQSSGASSTVGSPSPLQWPLLGRADSDVGPAVPDEEVEVDVNDVLEDTVQYAGQRQQVVTEAIAKPQSLYGSIGNATDSDSQGRPSLEDPFSNDRGWQPPGLTHGEICDFENLKDLRAHAAAIQSHIAAMLEIEKFSADGTMTLIEGWQRRAVEQARKAIEAVQETVEEHVLTKKLAEAGYDPLRAGVKAGKQKTSQ